MPYLKKLAALLFPCIIAFVALTYTKIFNEGNIPVEKGLILCFFIFISNFLVYLISKIEKKKLEDKIILQHSQMASILNNTPLNMYLKDIEGKILLTNNKYCSVINLTKEQLIGRNTYNIYKNSEICKKEDQKVIQTKECILTERNIETVNGSSFWCRVIKSPVFNTSGDVVSIVVIFQNINSEKEIEERKNTFVATMTHDLKTPTIAQIRALDLLLKNSFGALNEAQKETVTQIKNSCNYMYKLIYTILDTYLYDNGQTSMKYEEFNIIDLINETINEISNLAVEREQHITINSKLSGDNITADRFQLKRVITNMLSNAINYGFKNTDIEIITEDDSKNIKVSIKNKANYIPEEKLIDIYEKFKTAQNAKFRKTSTGLGLYLSKQIIDAHKGSVYVSSNKNETCTFGFSIPRTTENITVENK